MSFPGVGQIAILVRKELGRNWRELVAVVWILFLGFLGPIAVSAIRSSVDEYLARQSKVILSADLSVSSLRAFRPEEIGAIKADLKPAKLVQETEFVTMGRVGTSSSLVEIKAVDAAAPVYGKFLFSDGRILLDANALDLEQIAWVYPDVLTQLRAKVGDLVQIGQGQFRIAGTLKEGPGTSQLSFRFAPTLYVGRRFVEETGLTAFGSQVYHRVYLRLAAGADLDQVSFRIKQVLPDPDIFLRTPDDAIQSFERFFQFFNLYLVVITLIIFALAWVSAFYILQIYLQERLQGSAILLTLGAGRFFIGALYAVQVSILLAAGCFLAGLFVKLGFSLSHDAIQSYLPEGLVFRLGWRDGLQFAWVALMSGVVFCIPLFHQLRSLSLNELLNQDALKVTRRLTILRRLGSFVLRYGPLLAVFIWLSATLLESELDAVKLMSAMVVCGVGGLLIGRVLFRLVLRIVRHWPGWFRVVAASVARSRFGTDVGFICLVLIALVMNLVPNLLSSLTKEFQPLERREFPALFLLNLPESGLDEITRFVTSEGGELKYVSPFIQARLLEVNGHEPESDYLRRFPVRVTYRAKPISSETVVAGHEFRGSYDESKPGSVPEVSVEEKFAARNHFQLGDRLKFDVQGMPVEAQVVSLRKIRWTQFNPNFFMSFQTGVLENAPKTFIANVMIPDSSKKPHIVFDLLSKYPEINVIDIGQSIGRGLEIAMGILKPVRWTSLLALLMCFLVLFSVVSHNLGLRNLEIDVQKMMGADAGLIRNMMVSEYLLTASLAYLVGASGAAVITTFICVRILDLNVVISWSALLVSSTLIILGTGTMAWVAAQRVLRQRGARSF